MTISNLQLLSNGEIVGVIADQPSAELLSATTSTEFTFSVNAFSPNFSLVNSTKQFTVTVYQEFDIPTDILYIQAAPSIHDRQILQTLFASID